MITIKFHKILQPFVSFRQEHTLDASSFVELFYSCTCLFPKLDAVFKKVAIRKTAHEEFIFIVNGKMLETDCLLLQPKETDEIILCPIIYGQGGNTGMILLGVALIAASMFLPGSGVALVGLGHGGLVATTGATALAAGGSLTLLGSTLLGIGFNVILSAIMQSMAPKPPEAQSSDSPARQDNNMFGALVNTTSTITPIGLSYGLVRLGGQFISGRVKSIQHGAEETVLVGDFI